MPPCKGKDKVSKDIDESKSSMQTTLLPNDIVFEGPHLGWVPILKFKYWDLTNHKKFSHLVTKKLIRRWIDVTTGTIELESQKWLKGVEKVELLNLL